MSAEIRPIRRGMNGVQLRDDHVPILTEEQLQELLLSGNYYGEVKDDDLGATVGRVCR